MSICYLNISDYMNFDIFYLSFFHAGKLRVSVHGPKDGFDVKTTPSSGTSSRVVLCSYNPTAEGVYTVSVLWSSKHIPGSPFHVMRATSVNQLKKWKQNKVGVV